MTGWNTHSLSGGEMKEPGLHLLFFLLLGISMVIVSCHGASGCVI